MIFSGFEKDLDVNEFNHDFLVSYHSKLIKHLIETFSFNKFAVSCFLSQEFKYSGRDWNSGERWMVHSPLGENKIHTIFQKNKWAEIFRFFLLWITKLL